MTQLLHKLRHLSKYALQKDNSISLTIVKNFDLEKVLFLII